MVRCALLLVAVVCIAFVSADERTEKAKQLLQKCFKETGATPDNLKAFVSGQGATDALKCMLKCSMEGQQVLNADGSIDANGVTRIAGEDKRASAEKCTVEATSGDLCEKAYQFNTCFLAAQPDYVKETAARLTA